MGTNAPEQPDRLELECLRRIDAWPSDQRNPCSTQILQRLRELGWIESYTALWMPLEMRHTAYRLTAKGRRILLDSTR